MAELVLTKATLMTYDFDITGPLTTAQEAYKQDLVSHVLGLTELNETNGVVEVIGNNTAKRYWINQDVAESYVAYCYQLGVTYDIDISEVQVVDYP